MAGQGGMGSGLPTCTCQPCLGLGWLPTCTCAPFCVGPESNGMAKNTGYYPRVFIIKFVLFEILGYLLRFLWALVVFFGATGYLNVGLGGFGWPRWQFIF